MEESLSHLHIAAGPGGWVKAFWRRGADGRERSAFIKFSLDERDRWWRPIELRLANPTGRRLRDVPMWQIEQAANAMDVVTDTLANNIAKPVPGDLDDAFRAHRRAIPRKPLKRPAGRALNDAFFHEVAFTYRDAIMRGLPPHKVIGEDTGAPAGTVNRWISEARKRGHLPATQPGKTRV